MRLFFVITFIFFTTSVFSQYGNDTIKNFTLSYLSGGGGRDYKSIVKIDKHGNVLAEFYDGDFRCGKKKIKLDKNTFRQFKNIIITKVGYYSLPDTIKSEYHCSDCSWETVKITTSIGTKILTGEGIKSNSHFGDDFKEKESIKLLFDTIDEMVGFIGTNDY